MYMIAQYCHCTQDKATICSFPQTYTQSRHPYLVELPQASTQSPPLIWWISPKLTHWVAPLARGAGIAGSSFLELGADPLIQLDAVTFPGRSRSERVLHVHGLEFFWQIFRQGDLWEVLSDYFLGHDYPECHSLFLFFCMQTNSHNTS